MPRVIFDADFVYRPTKERRVSIKYKAGDKVRLVTSDCAGKAITAAKGRLAPEQAAPVRRSRAK